MQSTILAHGPLRLIPLLFGRLGPVAVAFIGSILLSLIAISGSISPNNDGMLYLEAAGLYQAQGFAAAQQVFDWLFLPVLIATVSSATGLGLEAAGYLISTLLLAGVCALIVASSRQQFPETGWAACAVVLALPVLNAYRDYIVREFGAWLFLFLALWIVLHWVRRPTWWAAGLVQASIGVAALFRPEVLAFLFALIIWLTCSVRELGGLSRWAMMSALPVLVASGLVVALLTGVIDLPARVVDQLSSLDPALVLQRFDEAADRMAADVLIKYSADEAHSILFFGMLSILPLKFLSNLGVFFVPLGYGLLRRQGSVLLKQWSPSWSWAWLTYLLVLVAFLFKKMFLTARYVSLLDLLVIPLIAAGLVALFRAMPRWRWLFVVIIAAVMVSNVITTSPRKTHYVEAAAWLSRQVVTPEQVYIEDAEIAHLAGWSYSNAAKGITARAALAKAVAEGRFELVLVRASAKDQDAEQWAQAHGLDVLERFYDGRGRGVLVLRPSLGNERTVPATPE